MNVGDLFAALLLRDLFRGRRERQRVRDQASIQFDTAYRSIEAIVIDDFARANNDVMAGLDAIDKWLDGFDADATVDDAVSEERFDSALEPLRVWARSAKPRLLQALAELNRIRSVAPELRRPADAYALVSEVVNAVMVYESAADAFLAGDFDNGHELLKQAHIAWRQMQGRHGLASYV